ncbi:MAG: hypothetical protein HC912_02010 [Saprospiraceae bacterium]|nr:hypothetical protein [Saprospiraceae bacterium]
MNTLFEKFKDYALTKEQASQVSGGNDCDKSISDEDVKFLASLNPGMPNWQAYHLLMLACKHAVTATRL